MTPERIDTDLLLILRVLHVEGVLTNQQFKTLSGQVRAGNPEGAKKGLRKIIKRSGGLSLEVYKDIGAALGIPGIMFKE